MRIHTAMLARPALPLLLSSCLLGGLLLTACGSQDAEPEPSEPQNETVATAEEPPQLTGDELAATIAQDVLVLDVRQPDEIEQYGTTEGSLNIPIDELEARLQEVPKDKPVLTA